MDIKLSKSGNHIMFLDITYVKGLEASSRIGCLAIEPGANSDKVLNDAITDKNKFKFTTDAPVQGYSKIVRV